MSKKINPKSLRLGVSERWSKNFQLYSKNFILFNNYYHKFLQFHNFVKNTLYSNEKFLMKKTYWFFKSTTVLHLHLTSTDIDFFIYERLFKNFYNFIFKFHPLKLLIFFSKKLLIFYSYIDYLSMKLKYPPKKLVNFMTSYLNQRLYSKNFMLCKSGPKKTFLKGFKMRLNGRFDVSKTNMSKKFSLQVGKMTSMDFNTKIDFLSKSIYSKYGIYNLKVWVFYQIVN
uniref:ribosomal protein S3 n=1 Tax=Bostrychia tenuissima TaxID=196631 RepID=UPI002E78E9A2|nr:ribosomal protein S3 [Bostrychia tenuissima]WQF69430.1 ribosomal protein S3 [Bostrychia tenuissima]